MTNELFDRALKNGDTSAMQIFEKGNHDKSLFHLAVEKDNVNLVGVMLEYAKNAKISRPKDFGQAEVRDAVLTDSCEIVKLLFDEGTDVRAVDEDGRTYLHLAASIGGESMMLTLLKAEVLDAVGTDSCEIVKLMFDEGTDVWTVDEDGRTYLHLAASIEGESMNRLNFENGVLYKPDKKGRTPLHYAAYYGSKASADFFISHGEIFLHNFE